MSLTPADLEPFASIDEAKAEAMIDDALAMAAQVAPCIFDNEFASAPAAKAIIRGAILRWHDADSGAITQQTMGPFQVTIDSNTRRYGMFWPAEIRDLRKLCAASGTTRRAYTSDMDAQ